MKSETYFIFCFCGGSGVVVIMPHPALFLVSYSFIPIFSPQVWIMLKGHHIEITRVFTFLALSLPSQLLLQEFQDNSELLIAEIEGILYEIECCAW
jgi:hypothetical protein